MSNITTKRMSSVNSGEVFDVISLLDEAFKASFNARLIFEYDETDQIFTEYFKIPHITQIQMVIEHRGYDVGYQEITKLIKLHMSEQQLKDIYDYFDSKDSTTSISYFDIHFD